MEVAMREKVKSTFFANSLIGLPNVVPTSIEEVARKDIDPYIELYLN